MNIPRFSLLRIRPGGWVNAVWISEDDKVMEWDSETRITRELVPLPGAASSQDTSAEAK